MGLEVGIWASRLGFGPQDWDLSLETGIWALRLRFKGGRLEKVKKVKEWPLPKRGLMDQLTNQ